MHVIKTAHTHTHRGINTDMHIYTNKRSGRRLAVPHTHMQVTGKLIAHFVSVVVVLATLPCAVALLPWQLTARPNIFLSTNPVAPCPLPSRTTTPFSGKRSPWISQGRHRERDSLAEAARSSRSSSSLYPPPSCGSANDAMQMENIMSAHFPKRPFSRSHEKKEIKLPLKFSLCASAALHFQFSFRFSGTQFPLGYVPQSPSSCTASASYSMRRLLLVAVLNFFSWFHRNF